MSTRIPPDRGRRIELALLRLAGADPSTTTTMRVEFGPDDAPRIEWHGVKRITAEQLGDVLHHSDDDRPRTLAGDRLEPTFTVAPIDPRTDPYIIPLGDGDVTVLAGADGIRLSIEPTRPTTPTVALLDAAAVHLLANALIEALYVIEHG